ncbi:diacylglycerol kinase family protein [Bacteroidia bacterium]|nr:diacylglycerol kinase family protein [Bacteroidia bacterium]
MSTKNILIIYNPAAHGGTSLSTKDDFVKYLKSKSIAYTIHTTNDSNDAEEVGLLIQKNNFDLISIIGGDGTINLAINSMPHFELPIHLIPAGSGNDLAKMLYNTNDMQHIFSLVAQELVCTTPVDLWLCNDKKFANGFGAGFDGAIANGMDKKSYLIKGKIKYWIEIFRHIFFYKSSKYLINGDKQDTFMLSIANGKVYGGDFCVAPNATIDDQLLDAIHIGDIPVYKRFYYLPILKSGKHLSRDFVSPSKGDSFTISADKNIPAHLDGEPLLEKSYEIKYLCQVQALC